MRAALTSLALVLVACGIDRPHASQDSPILARVGKSTITKADLERELAREDATARARYENPQARAELLDGLVRFEVMAQAAAARGYMDDPEVVRYWKQQAINRFIQKEVGDRTAPDAIAAEDVKRYYEEHREREFATPSGVRVRHILLADAASARRVAEAARALAPGDDRGFLALVEAHDRDPGARVLDLDERTPRPRALLAAALALEKPGDVVGPIATDAGHHVVRLLARRAAVVRTLPEVEGYIRQTLHRQRRQEALEALITKLRAEAGVELGERP